MTYYISLLFFGVSAYFLVRAALSYFSASNRVLSSALTRLQVATQTLLQSEDLPKNILEALDVMNVSATAENDKLLFFRTFRRQVKRNANKRTPTELEVEAQSLKDPALRDAFSQAVRAWATVLVIRNPLIVFYMTYRSFRKSLRESILCSSSPDEKDALAAILRSVDKRRAC